MLEQDTIPAIAAQEARVANLLHDRQVTTAEAKALLASLAEGWDDGMQRTLGVLTPLPDAGVFMPLPYTGPRPGLVLSGRRWQRSRLMKAAGVAAAGGEIATVICLGPTPRAHRMQFTDQGFIDFNKAYNPYCAYNHTFSCPIPPLENNLPIAIPVGVKAFK